MSLQKHCDFERELESSAEAIKAIEPLAVEA